MLLAFETKKMDYNDPLCNVFEEGEGTCIVHSSERTSNKTNSENEVTAYFETKKKGGLILKGKGNGLSLRKLVHYYCGNRNI